MSLSRIRPAALAGISLASLLMCCLTMWCSTTWTAAACDFCGPVNLTISEELSTADVAVVVTMTKTPDKVKEGKGELSKALFRVDHVLKGGKHLRQGDDGKPAPVEVFYFGDAKVNTQFILMGLDPPKVKWGSPLPLTPKGVDYVLRLLKLPLEGAERLEFFQPYLEHADSLLARDAYDEFAKAPYADFRKLKPKMNRAQLLKWIADKELPLSRKRLYLMLLSVCGTADDLPMLKDQLTAKPESNEPRIGMEPIMVAYLMLAGDDGMKSIDELFMANKKASYTDIYSAIMALRFMGQEQDRIDKKRILQSFKHMLDRPEYADLIIPDLARWEDWSAMDRLVELFKTTKDENAWVRVPVVQYLLVCPLPKAKTYIAELTKIDPESVRRANFILPLSRPKATAPEATAKEGAIKQGTIKQGTEKSGAEKKPAGAAKSAQPETPAKTKSAGASEGAAALVPPVEPLAEVPASAVPTSDPRSQQATAAAGGALGNRIRWLSAAGLCGVYLVFLGLRWKRRDTRKS